MKSIPLDVRMGAKIQHSVDVEIVCPPGKEVELADATHNLNLNEIDLARPNKLETEGPKTAAEESGEAFFHLGEHCEVLDSPAIRGRKQ